MKEPVAADWSGVIAGIKRSLPLALSIFTYGISFGVLARQAGLSLVEAFLMSSLVFAGASQFIALELWHSPLPIATLLLTTLVINLRHILMSASLSPWFLKLPAWNAYGCFFFLNDESWALTMAEFAKGKPNAGFLLGTGLMTFIAWVSSTVVGQLLGSTITDPAQWGLDFAFTAVFIVLLVSLWRGKSNFLPWTVAAIVAVATAYWLPGKWYILLGGIAGSSVGAIRDAD
jgi:4-azaleucine resistance transporter AzlC